MALPWLQTPWRPLATQGQAVNYMEQAVCVWVEILIHKMHRKKRERREMVGEKNGTISDALVGTQRYISVSLSLQGISGHNYFLQK